jgi:arylsulfatase A-like enzyme
MKPNVILIVCDTLRADHLSSYGYPRITSPFIDSLAASGTIFNNCYAPAIPTHPGFTTILSGIHPLEDGIVSHMGQKTFDKHLPWLPETLSNNGYETIAFDNLSKWFERGFDRYINTGENATGISDIVAEDVNNKVNEHLDELSLLNSSQKPFFLFLHYWDTHTPYNPPQQFLERFYKDDKSNPLSRGMEKVKMISPIWFIHKTWLEGVTDIEYVSAAYDAEILYMDTALRNLFDNFKKRNLLDNSIVILTADHGESLTEHDVYFDHHTIYNTNIHVPLIMSGAAFPRKNSKDYGLCQQLDITPTLLSLLGIQKNKIIYGQNLLDLSLRNESGDLYDKIISLENTWESKISLTTRQYKLIRTVKDVDLYGRKSGYLELYDLKKDPEENVNLVYSSSKVVEMMNKAMDTEIEQILQGRSNPIIEQPCSLRGNFDPNRDFANVRGRKLSKNVCAWKVPDTSDILSINMRIQNDKN